MFLSITTIAFYVLVAAALLVLPGLALLRLSVIPRKLDPLSRLVVAPGLTIAIAVLIFTWCDLVHLKPGPALPWILIVGSVLILILVRASGPRLPRRTWFNFQLMVPAAALATVVLAYLALRFRATWGWCVPPGVDTEQHTMIVQLLLEHGGLFQSWAPYSDAETFTYHFGFHAITATFGWLTGLPGWSSVFIMGRVIGAAAAVSLFAMVRLWTRSPWGGVFAAAFWLVSSSYLYPFETMGRWTLLAGLVCLTSNLVLFSLYLRNGAIRDRLWLGAACGVTAAGLVLTQYKSGIVFAALCFTLIASRCVIRLLNRRPQKGRALLLIFLRAAAVAGIALLLAGPRLNTVLHGESGHYLKRIVVEAPAAASIQYDQPTLSGLAIIQSGLGTARKAIVSALALIGFGLALVWRRRALWFFAGWILITLLMNPRLVGSSRIGLIDQTHWALAVEFAVAAMAGLTIGLAAEIRSRTPWAASTIVPIALLAVLIIPASKNLPPVFDSVRYVLPDDVRLMEWIAREVPDGDMIAGRGYFDHGEVLGRDAMMWLPHFTKHRTNHTNLAAGLERGPAEFRAKLRDFTNQLYARDMSTVESAQWMGGQGFRWFYVGALELNQDLSLLDQLARNPGLEVAWAEGAARIYHLR